MNYLGDFSAGETIYVWFHTFSSDDPSASMTITGLAVTDIEIYKDGNMTQRASDAGYTLIDTDGIDVDTITGIHAFSIDTADNTTADFFTAGSDYAVVVSSITLDAATINFVAAEFSIENRRVAGEMAKTTIATLASQTSFTLTTASADDDAYNNCTIVVSDIASQIQKCHGRISDYTGSTKTVTLAADPGIFTMAAGDNVSILAPTVATSLVGHTVQTGDNFVRLGAPAGASVSADIATVDTNVDSILVDTAEIGTAGAGLTDLGGMSTTMKAEVNAEADTAITDAALATAAALATVDANVDTLLTEKITKNAAHSNFEFLMVNGNGSPLTGLTVTGTRSLDGAAFAAVGGTIAEVGNGIYQFDALAADTNGDTVTWRFTAGTAEDTFVHFNTVS